MKKSQILKAIQEVLEEMSTTGGVAGYSTPNAFAKKGQGDNPATKLMKKYGYSTVKTKKRPYDTKAFTYLDEMQINTPHVFVSETQMEDSSAVKKTEEMGYKLVKKTNKASDKKNK